MKLSASVSLLGLILALGGVAKAQSAPHSGWVLDNVSVVDTRTGRVAPRRSILIEGGRIARVGAPGAVGGRGLRHVNGAGAFVVPGYNDMHAHPLNPGSPPGGLQLMLANGITGFRQMSGSPELLAARRAGRFAQPDAPALLATASTILTPPLVAPTPDAVIAEIRQQRAQGADFIKVVALPPPAFFAGLAEARRLGIPMAGHLIPAIDVRQASDRGMRAIEHLGPRESILLGCSTDEAAIRVGMLLGPPPTLPPITGAAGVAAMQRALSNPMLLTPPAAYLQFTRVLDTYSDARCRELVGHFVRNQTWQVPTLIRLRTMQFGDDPAYRNDPNLRFIPPRIRQLWQSLGEEFAARVTPEQHRILARLWAAQLALVRLFDQNGVPMMAGSDYGGGWEIAGYSLHQEFDLLREAGLSPLRILQLTTTEPARFLGREASMGTVEAGRNADLVLLAANPVASTANLHRIRGVVRGGRYFPRAELDAMIATVARQAAESTASVATEVDGHLD
jgi:imidazolonepropionase-like amidohydrolase